MPTNSQITRSTFRAFIWCLLLLGHGVFLAAPLPQSRVPADDLSTRRWLENMIWYHHFSDAEIADATGLENAQIHAAQEKWNIHPHTRPVRTARSPVLVLPYPGGRHPRIGFLDGAVEPQRETKISVFTPWDENSYVVADIPEAIWSQHGLLYLAHTHVPTIWTKKNISLERLEWDQRPDGSLVMERRLPNGVVFGTKVVPGLTAVRMEMWLTNGSPEILKDLRVQNCVMLKGAADFNQLTNANKVMEAPYVAARSSDGERWVITAWVPTHRTWANAPVPCLHSDPKFPDCAPGQTQRLRGWLSFYEGTDITNEFRRINATGWQDDKR